jgi:hypothetical protein
MEPLNDLPGLNQCGFVIAIIHLQLESVCVLDYRLDDSFHDAP